MTRTVQAKLREIPRYEGVWASDGQEFVTELFSAQGECVGSYCTMIYVEPGVSQIQSVGEAPVKGPWAHLIPTTPTRDALRHPLQDQDEVVEIQPDSVILCNGIAMIIDQQEPEGWLLLKPLVPDTLRGMGSSYQEKVQWALMETWGTILLDTTLSTEQVHAAIAAVCVLIKEGWRPPCDEERSVAEVDQAKTDAQRTYRRCLSTERGHRCVLNLGHGDHHVAPVAPGSAWNGPVLTWDVAGVEQ